MQRLSATVLFGVLLGLCGVVATVFRPMVDHSPHRARRIGCQSNLKNIGLAFQQYRADYDETYPIAQAGLPGTAGWATAGWTTAGLAPYLKRTSVLDCSENGALAGPPAAVTDYVYNLRLSGSPSRNLVRPVFTILLGEGEAGSADYACRDFSHCAGQTAAGPAGPIPEAARTRHLDGANMAFADGHVKWRPSRTQGVQPHAPPAPASHCNRRRPGIQI